MIATSRNKQFIAALRIVRKAAIFRVAFATLRDDSLEVVAQFPVVMTGEKVRHPMTRQQALKSLLFGRVYHAREMGVV